MEEKAISQAHGVSAKHAISILESEPDALLVDVRDESEIDVT